MGLGGGGRSRDLSEGSRRGSGGGRRWRRGGEGDGGSEERCGVEDDELGGGGDLRGYGLDVGVGEGPGLAGDGGGDAAPDGGHAVPEGSQAEEGDAGVPVRSSGTAAHEGIRGFAARHGQRGRSRRTPGRDGAAAAAGGRVARGGVHRRLRVNPTWIGFGAADC